MHITNKVAHRACRASRDGRVALFATCSVALVVQPARHSTYEVFLYQNAWDGVS